MNLETVKKITTVLQLFVAVGSIVVIIPQIVNVTREVKCKKNYAKTIEKKLQE